MSEKKELLTAQEETVLNIIRCKGKIMKEDIINELGLGATRSYNILKKLVNDEYLETQKIGKKLFYFLK